MNRLGPISLTKDARPARIVLFHTLSVALLVILCWNTHGIANADEIPLAQLQSEYERSVQQLRASLKDFYKTRYSFEGDDRERSEYWREQWQDASDRCKTAAEKVSQIGRDLFMRTESPDEELTNLALQVAHDDFLNHRYENSLAIVDRALAKKDDKTLHFVQANLCLMTNQFDRAATYFRANPDAVENLPKFEQNLVANLESLAAKFAQEKARRQQEAEADDLPRVEFQTTAGNFTVELFENEAPQTVGNFIDLVQNGYYRGVIFHRVKEKFAAQAGGFAVVQTDKGPQVAAQGVRYKIYDEFENENARSHFRGYVSMANQNQPDTGSSQFFICLAPLTPLDGNHTVFGRVIDGMSAVSDLAINVKDGEKGEEEQIKDVAPTLILSARVIRKRDHNYEPVAVGVSSETPNGQNRNEANDGLKPRSETASESPDPTSINTNN